MIQVIEDGYGRILAATARYLYVGWGYHDSCPDEWNAGYAQMLYWTCDQTYKVFNSATGSSRRFPLYPVVS